MFYREYKQNDSKVVPREGASMISYYLSDNTANL